MNCLSKDFKVRDLLEGIDVERQWKWTLRVCERDAMRCDSLMKWGFEQAIDCSRHVAVVQGGESIEYCQGKKRKAVRMVPVVLNSARISNSAGEKETGIELAKRPGAVRLALALSMLLTSLGKDNSAAKDWGGARLTVLHLLHWPITSQHWLQFIADHE